jgi:hypothetical protein
MANVSIKVNIDIQKAKRWGGMVTIMSINSRHDIRTCLQYSESNGIDSMTITNSIS